MTDSEREVVREVIALASDLAPLPPWVPRWLAGWFLAGVIAGVLVAASRIDVAAALRAWHEKAAPGPPNEAPPMDMPAGGMSVPGPGEVIP